MVNFLNSLLPENIFQLLDSRYAIFETMGNLLVEKQPVLLHLYSEIGQEHSQKQKGLLHLEETLLILNR